MPYNKEERRIRNKNYYQLHAQKIRGRSKLWRDNHKGKQEIYGKLYYQNNKEKINIRQRVYYEMHKIEMNKCSKNYSATHKQENKIYMKAYCISNKEEIKARKKIYHDNHKKEIKERQNTWHKLNRDKHREYDRKRRAQKYETKIEPIKEKLVFIRDGWICQICHKRVDKRFKYPNPMSASLDHILPLSRGGTHTYANIQLTHWVCNISKKNNILLQGEQLRMF